MKKALTILASAALATTLILPGGLSSAAPPQTAQPGTSAAPALASQDLAYTPPALRWGECDNERLAQAGAQCAMMTVPLDYAHPKGRKIQIAVSRIKHTNPDYKGMMVANPGGPGGSGLTMSRLGGAIPSGIGDKYDWYGFDPRGVGSSTPSLSCNPKYPGMGVNRPNYIPDGKGSKRWWQRVARKYAVDCGKSTARRLLPHMRTQNVARDLESLRRAAGNSLLNYYGFSYGTYLGQVYATMYPRRVGKMVWDGVLNADNAFYKANVEQNIAFDKNFNIFLRWVARNNASFGLGTDWRKIRQGYYRLLKRLDAKPAKGTLGPDEVSDVMLGAGYYVYGWVDLAHTYAALVKGDPQPMIDAYGTPSGDPGADNSFAVYNGVQCIDAPWPGWRQTQADAIRTDRKHPFLTWGNTWFNAPCLNWPVKPGKRFQVGGVKLKNRVLLIAETHDAATVYSGALATRRKFPTSFLIEGKGGTTHSGSLSGVACTDNTIARYLDTGRLPRRVAGNRSDKQCAAVPQPSPTAARPAQRDPMPQQVREDLLKAQLIGR